MFFFILVLRLVFVCLGDVEGYVGICCQELVEWLFQQVFFIELIEVVVECVDVVCFCQGGLFVYYLDIGEVVFVKFVYCVWVCMIVELWSGFVDVCLFGEVFFLLQIVFWDGVELWKVECDGVWVWCWGDCLCWFCIGQ